MKTKRHILVALFAAASAACLMANAFRPKPLPSWQLVETQYPHGLYSFTDQNGKVVGTIDFNTHAGAVLVFSTPEIAARARDEARQKYEQGKP